jgi:hypothetical protein
MSDRAIELIENKHLVIDGARFDVIGKFDGQNLTLAIDDTKLEDVLECNLTVATDAEGNRHPMLVIVNQKNHTFGLRTRDFLSFFKVKKFTFQVEVEA